VLLFSIFIGLPGWLLLILILNLFVWCCISDIWELESFFVVSWSISLFWCRFFFILLHKLIFFLYIDFILITLSIYLVSSCSIYFFFSALK
jgi:hypothetical protein